MQPNSICSQIALQLDAFHDGELSRQERADVEKHLVDCSDCVARLGEIDQVVHALKAMPRRTLPVALSVKLDSIADNAAGNKVVAMRSRMLFPTAAAAAAIVALFAGARLLMPGEQPAVTAHSNQPPTRQQPIANRQPETAPIKATPLEPPAPEVAAVQPIEHLPLHLDAASQTPPVAHNMTPPTVMHNGRNIAQLPPPVAAPAQPNMAALGTDTSDLEIAELPTSNNSFTEAIGLATDEDGLYDIKM